MSAVLARTLGEQLVDRIDSPVVGDVTPADVVAGDLGDRESALSRGERSIVTIARHIRDIGALAGEVDRTWQDRIAAALHELADEVGS